MAILQATTNGRGETPEQELARLRAENAKLKAAKAGKPTIKVNAIGGTNAKGEDYKGTVSVYGLGRYPVTLYPGQWLKLLDLADDIRQDIEDNRDVLAWKD